MDLIGKLKSNNLFRSRKDELFTNMRSIFSTGRNGYLHRFTTTELNQLSTGTTPVTAVTDPVGLVMDTRLGLALGPELVDTINTAAAWTASGTNTVAQDGDAVKITYVDNAAGAVALFSAAAGLSSNLTVGANYKITYEIKVNSGSVNAAVVNASTNQSVAVTSTDYITQSFVFNASNATTNNFTFANMSAGEIVWIKNISVKLLDGNHAIQATAAARPTWTNLVNLLTYTEQFDVAYWVDFGTKLITPNTATAPDGQVTADTLYSVAGNGLRSFNITGIPALTTYVGSVYVKPVVSGSVVLKLAYNGGAAVVYTTTQALTAGVWTRVEVTGAAGAGDTGMQIQVSTDASANQLYIWGAQLEFGSTATRYQRVTTATDFDTAGFPYYLSFLGTDDSLTSATGGGGTLGVLWCGVIQPTGGAGTLRTIFADNGVNTGYKVQIDASNKLSFSAGNGAAFTTLASTAALSVGTKYLLTVRDNGTNLSVQINSAAAETVARPVVAAGTAGFTIGKDNGAASSYLIANKYPAVYYKDTGGTDAEVANAQAYCRMMGGLV